MKSTLTPLEKKVLKHIDLSECELGSSQMDMVMTYVMDAVRKAEKEIECIGTVPRISRRV